MPLSLLIPALALLMRLLAGNASVSFMPASVQSEKQSLCLEYVSETAPTAQTSGNKQPQFFYPNDEKSLRVKGLIVGIMLGMVLCALVVTMLLVSAPPRWYYGYFFFYGCCFSVLLLYDTIIAADNFYSLPSRLYEVLRAGVSILMPLAGTLFIRRFLDARFFAKRTDMLLLLMVLVYASSLLFSLAGYGALWQTQILPIANLICACLLLFLVRVVIRKKEGHQRLYVIEILAVVGFIAFVLGQKLMSSGLRFLVGTGYGSLDAEILSMVLICVHIALFPTALLYRMLQHNMSLAAAARERGVIEQEVLAEHRRNDALRRANTEILSQQDLVDKQRRQIEAMNVALQENNFQLGEQNLQLRELHKEKDEFLGIVAHDLKNPLGAIASFANIIKYDDSSLSPEHRMEFIDHIIESAERMFEIIRNLLDINALERGGLRFHLQPVEISSIVTYAVGSFAQRAAEKNITFHTELNPVLYAVADEQLVMQVVDNLISNAVKYSPHGKNVYICISNNNDSTENQSSIPAKDAQGQDSVRISVRDEGPGVSEEDKQKMFGKFARLSAQPTGGEHSTGLGLSIVKKMVEGMNGRVWCESVVEQGATFIVELPMVKNDC